MSSRKNPRLILSKNPMVNVQVKSEPDLNEYSTKNRKQNSQSSKVSNEVDEPKSCLQCHRNLLVAVTESNPCPVCCNTHKEKEANVKDNLHHTSNVFSTLASSMDHQPATIEDQEGLWRGNAVGHPEKKMLQAVEDRYPQTFQGLEIIPKPYRMYTLKALHDFIKTFNQKSVHKLEEDELTSLETDIDFFEKIGFELSWARNRIQMVRNLKFRNDPLMVELVEATVRTERTHVEFEKARVEFEKAKFARNRKLQEMAQKYGPDYDDVLNGKLGFGMLP